MAGVKIGYGTDLLGPMHRYQSREFVIRAGATAPFDVIRSATAVNTELLNRSGELGVVATRGGRICLSSTATRLRTFRRSTARASTSPTS